MSLGELFRKFRNRSGNPGEAIKPFQIHLDLLIEQQVPSDSALDLAFQSRKIGHRGTRMSVEERSLEGRCESVRIQISTANRSSAFTDCTKAVISRITFSTSSKSAISTMLCM